MNWQVPAWSISFKFIRSFAANTTPFVAFSSGNSSTSLPTGMMRKNKLIFCFTFFEGFLEPIVLSFSERPVPVLWFFVYITVAVNIQYDESCITPSPSVIIGGQIHSIGFFIYISCIKTIRKWVWVIKLSPKRAIYANIIGRCLFQIIAIFAFVIAQTNKKRH